MKLVTNTKTYDLSDRTHIMGTLNVTPDSFSDGGSYTTIDRAVAQAKKMEEEGADFIDVGGESTRPGHEPVSADVEIERVIPAIKALKEAISVPISVDTYKATVAEKAIEAGAAIINDVWGAKKDPDMARVAAEKNVPIILMHNRTNMNYTSLIDDVKKDLQESIDIAQRAGVPDENIILDPGIGFAKTDEHDLILMNHLDELAKLGYPLLLGTSRKAIIKSVVNVPPQERDVATGATTCFAIPQGVQIVRVHDVQVHKHLAMMTDAMLAHK